MESPAKPFPSPSAQGQPSSQPPLWGCCPWPPASLLPGAAVEGADRLLQLHPAASLCPGTVRSRDPLLGQSFANRVGDGDMGKGPRANTEQPGCATAAGWAAARRVRATSGLAWVLGQSQGQPRLGTQLVSVPRSWHSPTLTTARATRGQLQPGQDRGSHTGAVVVGKGTMRWSEQARSTAATHQDRATAPMTLLHPASPCPTLPFAALRRRREAT